MEKSMNDSNQKLWVNMLTIKKKKIWRKNISESNDIEMSDCGFLENRRQEFF